MYGFIEDELVLKYTATKCLNINRIGNNITTPSTLSGISNRAFEVKVSAKVPQNIVDQIYKADTIYRYSPTFPEALRNVAFADTAKSTEGILEFKGQLKDAFADGDKTGRASISESVLIKYAEMNIFKPDALGIEETIKANTGGAWFDLNCATEPTYGKTNITFGAFFDEGSIWRVRTGVAQWKTFTAANLVATYPEFSDASSGLKIRSAIVNGKLYCLIKDEVVLTYDKSICYNINSIGNNITLVAGEDTNRDTLCNKVTGVKVSAEVPADILSIITAYEDSISSNTTLTEAKAYTDTQITEINNQIGDVQSILEDVLSDLEQI